MKNKSLSATAVSSFFYYMWNYWNEEECKTIFKNNYLHFWAKWCSLANDNVYVATERFYSELSEDNRALLVDRAVLIYDCGAKRKEKPVTEKVLLRVQELEYDIEELYHSIVELIKDNGGIVYTGDPRKNTIWGVKSVEDDYTEDVCLVECEIVGLRVEDNEIQAVNASDDNILKITKKDILNPDSNLEWNTVKLSSVLTLINIAKNIKEYLVVK